MDIMELGAIGELVGGIAVIASLIYVGIQVRQSTEQARQGNAIERARATREVTRDINDIFTGVREAELVALLRAALADFDRISRDEQGIISNRFLLPVLLHAVATFLATKDGLVDPQYAERWTAHMASIAKCRGLAGWWGPMKTLLHPEFLEAVERLMESPEGPPAYDELVPWFGETEAMAS